VAVIITRYIIINVLNNLQVRIPQPKINGQGSAGF
jgi:hypothetical protein